MVGIVEKPSLRSRRSSSNASKVYAMDQEEVAAKKNGPHLNITSHDLYHDIIPFFDTSGNQKISLEEFIHKVDGNEVTKSKKVLALLERLRNIREQLRKENNLPEDQQEVASQLLFEKFDDNNSGNMTVGELKDGLLQLGIVYSNFELRGRRYRFADRALGLWPARARGRRALARAVTGRPCEAAVLAAIALNSVALALEDFSDPGKYDPAAGLNLRNRLCGGADVAFTALFGAEALAKILAFGFVMEEGTYLRDGWNALDFGVAAAGALGLLGLPGLGALRACRALRPLRTLSARPGLRALVEALIASIPAMLNVFVLMLLFCAFFALLALQLWAGAVDYRCRATPLPAGPAAWATDPAGRGCAPGGGGLYRCPADYPHCASGAPSALAGRNLSFDYAAPTWLPEEMNWGVTRFDNILLALLSVFQVVTLENWVKILYLMQDCANETVAAVFFCLLVVGGGLFMINLMFAVMWEKYLSVSDFSGEDPLSQVQQKVGGWGAAGGSGGNRGVGGSGGGVGGGGGARSSRQASGSTQGGGGGSGQLLLPAGGGSASTSATYSGAGAGGGVARGSGGGGGGGSGAWATGTFKGSASTRRTLVSEEPSSDGEAAAGAGEGAGAASGGEGGAAVLPGTLGQLLRSRTRRGPGVAPAPGPGGEGGKGGGGAGKQRGPPRPIVPLAKATSMLPRHRHRRGLREKVERMVSTEGGPFQVFIFFLIILNTVILAMDKYPENTKQVEVTDKLNYALTAAFAAEMGLTLVGLGGRRYWRDPLYAFDGLVVLVTCAEAALGLNGLGGLSLGGATSALRFFRLGRLVKLAKRMKTLYKLLTQIIQSLKQVGNIILILFLFLYIFSLLGMQFFAYQFTFDEDGTRIQYDPTIEQDYWTPRVNFDNLFNALMAVFQIVTGEDYNLVMYDAVRARGYPAALFFVAALTLGNVIVLNMFLAILLSNFDLADNAEQEAARKARVDRQVRAKQRLEHLRHRAQAVGRLANAGAGKALSQTSRHLLAGLGQTSTSLLGTSGGGGGGGGGRRRESSAAGSPSPAAPGGGAGAGGAARRGGWRRSLGDFRGGKAAAGRARTTPWRASVGHVPSAAGALGADAASYSEAVAEAAVADGAGGGDPSSSSAPADDGAVGGGGPLAVVLETRRESERNSGSRRSSNTTAATDLNSPAGKPVLAAAMDGSGCPGNPSDGGALSKGAERGRWRHSAPLPGAVVDGKEDDRPLLSQKGISVQQGIRPARKGHRMDADEQKNILLSTSLAESPEPPARKLPALEQVRGKTEPAGQLLRYKSIGQLQEEMMAAATSLGAAEEEGKREHSENPNLTPPQQPNTEQPDLIDKEQEDGPSLALSFRDAGQRPLVPLVRDHTNQQLQLGEPSGSTPLLEPDSSSQGSSLSMNHSRSSSPPPPLPLDRRRGGERQRRASLLTQLRQGAEQEAGAVRHCAWACFGRLWVSRERRRGRRRRRRRRRVAPAAAAAPAPPPGAAGSPRGEAPGGPAWVPWAALPAPARARLLSGGGAGGGGGPVPRSASGRHLLLTPAERRRLGEGWERLGGGGGEDGGGGGRRGERARSARRGHYAASVRRRAHGNARAACRALVASPGFEGLVLGVILLSSVLLALANPLMDPDSAFYRLLSKTDLALTAIFGLEILIKLYAMGAKEYLLGKDRGWNALDVTIVALGAAAGVLPDASSLTSIRALRALRALRPLRLIQRYPGLKQVVNTMLEAVPSISNVLLVLCFFFLIFGIMGTTYFKGAFDHCNFDTVSTDVYSALEAEYGFTVGTFRKAFTKTDCLAAGGAWEKALDQHFDNVGRSMMTLYEISTLENWVGIMHAGIDAVGVERHPVENYRRAWALYFVFFVIVGNFFAMNLFVGAVIENYQKQKREDWTGLATPTQKAWIDAQRLMARAELVARRRVPRHPARAFAYRLVTLPGFDLAVMALVAANALVMMLRRTGEPAAQAAVVAAANSLFTLAFLAELALKLLAHGPRWPLRSGWNAFDAGVVAFASGAWLADGGGFFGGGGRLNAVAVSARVARVLLLFRLVRRARTLRALTEVVLQELPSIFNVLTLIFLVLFIFAVLGVNLFAAVVLQTELNAHANFQSFGRAFLTLFRFSGGEAWNAVMYELMVREDGTGSYLPGGTSCVPNPTHAQMAAAWEEAGDRTFMIGCGAPAPWAYLFFLAFTLLTAFIMINLFVAIIVDAVGDSSRREENPLGAEAFQEFCIKWNDIDEDATYTLAVEDLLTFVEKIDHPLGLGGLNPSKQEVRHFVYDLQLDSFGGKVYFYDVFKAMGNRLLLHHAIITRTADEIENLVSAKAGDRPSFFEGDKTETKQSQNEVQAQLSLGCAGSVSKQQQHRQLIKQSHQIWNMKKIQKHQGTLPSKSLENASQLVASQVIQGAVRRHLKAKRESIASGNVYNLQKAEEGANRRQPS